MKGVSQIRFTREENTLSILFSLFLILIISMSAFFFFHRYILYIKYLITYIIYIQYLTQTKFVQLIFAINHHNSVKYIYNFCKIIT